MNAWKRSTVLSILWFCSALLTQAANRYHWSQVSVSVAENEQTVELELLREGDLSGPSSVEYTTRSVNALPGVDYVATQGSFNFRPGATTAFVSVPILNNGKFDPPRAFMLVLTNLPFGWVADFPSTARVNIQDNDPGFSLTPIGIGCGPSPLDGSDSDCFASLTLHRGSDSTNEVWVDYEIKGITAVPGLDVVDAPGRVHIKQGADTETFNVRILKNPERATSSRTFAVQLKNPMPGTHLDSASPAEVTIPPSGGGPWSERGPQGDLMESDPSCKFLVYRGEWPADGTLEVDYKTVAATATTGEDFIPAEGRLVFAPGEFQKEIEIPILNDSVPEETEYFSLQLFQVPGFVAPASPATSGVNIWDNDGGFSFDYQEYIVGDRGPSTFPVLVHRSHDSDLPQTVAYRTFDITSTEGVDYQPIAGRLVFEPGQQTQILMLRLLPNSNPLLNPTLGIELFDPVGGVLSPYRSLMRVIIPNQTYDSTEAYASIQEGADYGVADVYRFGSTAEVATVRLMVFPASAQDTSGLPSFEGNLSFASGQSHARLIFPTAGSSQISNGATVPFPIRVTQVSGHPLGQLPLDAHGYVYPQDKGFRVTRNGGDNLNLTGITGRVSFEVRRFGDLSGSASVEYSVAPGGSRPKAMEGADFVRTNGVVSFRPGESIKPIWIQLLGDPHSATGYPRNLQIRLSNAVGDTPLGNGRSGVDGLATVYPVTLLSGNTSFVGTDPSLLAPLRWVGPLWTSDGVPETEGKVELKLERYSGLDQPASYRMEIAASKPGATLYDNTALKPATPGVDFEESTSIVSFAAGQSVIPVYVHLHADQEPEGFEYFGVHFGYVDTPVGETFFGLTLLIQDTSSPPIQIRPLQNGEITAPLLAQQEASFADGSWLLPIPVFYSGPGLEIRRVESNGQTRDRFTPPVVPKSGWGAVNDPPYNGVTMAATGAGFWLLHNTAQDAGTHRLLRFGLDGRADAGFGAADLITGTRQDWDTRWGRSTWPASRILPVNDSEFLLIGPPIVNGRPTPFGCRIVADRNTLDVYPQDSRLSESSGSRTVGILRYGDLSQPASYHWSLVGISAREGLDFVAGSGEIFFPAGGSSARIPITLLHNPAPTPDSELIIRCAQTGGGTGRADIFVTVVNDDPGVLSVSFLDESRSQVRLTLTGVLRADLSRRSGGLFRSRNLRDWFPVGNPQYSYTAADWSSDLILDLKPDTTYFEFVDPE